MQSTPCLAIKEPAVVAEEESIFTVGAELFEEYGDVERALPHMIRRVMASYLLLNQAVRYSALHVLRNARTHARESVQRLPSSFVQPFQSTVARDPATPVAKSHATPQKSNGHAPQPSRRFASVSGVQVATDAAWRPFDAFTFNGKPMRRWNADDLAGYRRANQSASRSYARNTMLADGIKAHAKWRPDKLVGECLVPKDIARILESANRKYGV